MICIAQPYLRESASGVRLCADIETPGGDFSLWFEVDKEYAPYLCPERSDAFLAALLPTAFRQGADIRCQAPVSPRLLYQLSQYYIPALSGALPSKRFFSIQAPPAEGALPNAGAVATGFSGGVDSMYTVMSHLEHPVPGHALTHLAVMNVGAYETPEAPPPLFLKTCERVGISRASKG